MKDLHLFQKKTKIILKKVKIEWFIIALLCFNFYILIIAFQLVSLIKREKLVNKDTYQNSLVIHPFPFYDDTQSNIELSARSAIVLEKDSKVVVYQKNQSLRFSPASSAKIMTAFVALDSYSLDRVLQAQDIGHITGSKMHLYEGEEMRVIDLLYGLLLPSGNDAAYVLAQNYPGGINAFVDAMNKKAKSLHLLNTYFVDPSGLLDENYTTANDLAKLSAYALDNDVFRKIVATRKMIVYDAAGTTQHALENLNKLLTITGVTGVKTGFTQEAGGVLVSSFMHNGKTFIIVVLKSNDRFYDTEEIITKVVKNVELLSY